MIADRPDFNSVNRLSDVPSGPYLLVESTYRGGRENDERAVLVELVNQANGHVVGADLTVTLSDSSILFRDFAVAPDGAWRDSYGLKRDRLADLLPPDLASFTLVERLGQVVDHDGSDCLPVVDRKENSHGT